MAIADIFFCGWETGDLSQSGSAFGTGIKEASTEQAHTGTYSLKLTNSSSVSMRGLTSAGKVSQNFGRTAETFFTFWLRISAYPSSSGPVVDVRSSGFSSAIYIYCGTAGEITLIGTTTSATIATLSLDTWYRFDLRVTKNATSGLSIDGATEVTVTANNQTVDAIDLYGGAGVSTAFYFDDLVIGTTAPTAGAGPCVRMAVPIGSGNYSAWADGTGSTYAEVDEVPHDSDTSYLQDTAGTSSASTFDMQSAATVGIVGTINAVMGHAQMKESSSTTTSGGVRLRSGSTDSDSTVGDIGNTTYVSIEKLFTVDPADSAAWTTSKFDAIEVGPYKGTDNSSIRCTAVFLHVVEDGISVGGGDPEGRLIGGKLLRGGLLRGGVL